MCNSRQLTLSFAISIFVLLLAGTAHAQFGSSSQFNIAFGGGTTSAPTGPVPLSNGVPVSMSGGTYLSFSGDYLLWKNLGFGGEVAWRASRTNYGGQLPFRPILWDFDGVYGPRFDKHFGIALSAGIGGETLRFYTPFFTCSTFSCTNYVSSTHFMGQFGGALKLYPKGNFFISPEVHWYLVHNNVEFSSGHVLRYGISIGYTFGGQQ
jgi:hypothetical protein